MNIKIRQNCESSTGKAVFRFREGEVVDTATSEKLSAHPDPAKRVKLKDANFDAQKLIDLGLAEQA